jgi:hypothetical protein
VSSYPERLAALAALAFLSALVAFAVIERGEPSVARARITDGAPAPDGGWYRALAATRGPAGDAERTTCGLILTGRSLGVTHPVLPCGAKLLVRFGGDTVLTEVIDNRLKSAGRQFELTESLARRLGLDGTQQVRWRFAVAGGR